MVRLYCSNKSVDKKMLVILEEASSSLVLVDSAKLITVFCSGIGSAAAFGLVRIAFRQARAAPTTL